MNGVLGEDGLAALRHVAAREKWKEHEIVLLQNSSVLQKLKRTRKSVVLMMPVQVGKETLNT